MNPRALGIVWMVAGSGHAAACLVGCDGLIGLGEPRVRSDAGADAGPLGFPSPPAFSSGARLRAMVLDGGDGAVTWTGWFDSKLGAPCSFMTADDGQQRCLPGAGTYLFRDDQCSMPVWQVSGGTCPQSLPAFGIVGEYAPTSCELGGSTVYALGPQASAPFALATVSDGQLGAPRSDCTAGPASTSAQFVAPGPVLPPSSFVAATTRFVPYGDGSPVAHQLVTDDGATLVLAIANGMTGEDCWSTENFAPGSAYANRCVPSSFPSAEPLYADATCMQVASAVSVYQDTCSGSPPSAALVTASGRCGSSEVTVEALGAQASGSGLFTGSPGAACAPYAQSSYASVYATTGPVPASTFPAVRTANTGTGRLRVQSVVDEQGHAVLSEGTWTDTALGAPCTPTQFADGQRCAPASALWDYPAESPYADPQCTVPLLTTSSSTTCPAPEPSTVLVASDPCALVVTAYSVTGRVTPAMIYSLTSSGCAPQLTDPSMEYWTISPADDSGWAKMTTRTE
jgi:hypothetical protein